MALVLYNSVFVPLCSPNTCKGVFNSNVTTFQSNCAEGLHFSAFHCNSNFLPLILSHREKTEAKKSWLSIDHYTVIFVMDSCSLCMLDTIYFYFIFKVQHYTTNIYHNFVIITWKIEMAPKELHIPQFLPAFHTGFFAVGER